MDKELLQAISQMMDNKLSSVNDWTNVNIVDRKKCA